MYESAGIPITPGAAAPVAVNDVAAPLRVVIPPQSIVADQHALHNKVIDFRRSLKRATYYEVHAQSTHEAKVQWLPAAKFTTLQGNRTLLRNYLETDDGQGLAPDLKVAIRQLCRLVL